uniref:SRCR domain-containing protein n=1 Tax=Malurus cyaneus samueli TaxID=2593467 RepID=A0A8C5UHN9_9PASS
PPHNRHVSRLDRRASEPGARSLRLVGGGGRCAGRVEVKHRGEWGSSASSTSTGKRLGPGGVPAAGLWPGGQGVPAYPGQAGHGADLAPALLLSAPRMRWRRLFWSIQGSAAPCGCPGADAVELRLAGGGSPCAGRVEVKLQGRWGSVADENWDMEDAEVVCRELGCGVALGIPGSGRFGVGSGMLWEGGFQCNGSEPLLSACAQRAPHGQGCSGPASVICSRKCRGQRGGTWGSVCAAEWDLPDAHVLCRHLGCGRAFSVPPGGSLGGGEGPLRPDAFGCSGSERHPGECPVAVLGKGPCAPGNAAAVNCSGVCGTRGRSLKGFWNSPRIGIRGCRVSSSPCGWRAGAGAAAATWRCPTMAPGAACAPTAPAPAPPAPSAASWAAGTAALCGPIPPGSRPLPGWPGWAVRTGPARSGCPSAPWQLQSCGPQGDTYVQCEEDTDGSSDTDTPPDAESVTSTGNSAGARPAQSGLAGIPLPSVLALVPTGVPSRNTLAVAVGTVAVPTVLCVVLGTLLCLALAALAVLLCRARARRRGESRWVGAGTEPLWGSRPGNGSEGGHGWPRCPHGAQGSG